MNNKPILPSDEIKTYPIVCNLHYQLLVGIINEYQVMVYPMHHALLLLRFDLDGFYLKYYEYDYSEYNSNMGSVLERLNSLGFIRKTIYIHRFSIPNFFVGIKQIPSSMEDALAHPTNYNPLELAEIYQDISDWIDQEYFVLVWNEEYYLDHLGNIISS